MPKPRISAINLNTNRALLGVPLAITLIFSFGFVMAKHDTASPYSINSRSATASQESSIDTSRTSVAPQAELPTVSTPAALAAADGVTTGQNTTSPQTPSASSTQSQAQNAAFASQPATNLSAQQNPIDSKPQNLFNLHLTDRVNSTLQGLRDSIKK